MTLFFFTFIPIKWAVSSTIYNGEVDDILKAIQAVMNGDYYFYSSHGAELLRWLHMGMQKNVPAISISPREL